MLYAQETATHFHCSSYYSAKTKLSYTTVDRNMFYADLDKKLSVDEINAELDKPTTINWPSAMREEEVSISIILNYGIIAIMYVYYV